MELKSVFKERRSVNHFDANKVLDKEILKEIIDLAILAPSAFNLQPWRIIAVESDKAKERLSKVSNMQPKIKEAPVTLMLIGDKKSYRDENIIWKKLEETTNKEIMENAKKAANFLYGTSLERQLKFAESNTGLLAMSIMYAAKELGVDSHPMSGIDFDGIKCEFKLSEDEEPVMLIALGYFDESKTLYPRGYRKNYDEIVEEI